MRSVPSSSPRLFAPVFAGLLMFWPLVSLMGGQGFTVMLTLVSFAAVFALRPPDRLRLYPLVLAALVIWISATAIWSPATGGPILTGSLSEGTFAIKASPLRLLGIALAGAIGLVAAMRVAPGAPVKAGTVLICVFLAHWAVLMLTPVFVLQVFDLVYETRVEAMGSGMQNVLRHANAFTLAAAVLIAVFWQGTLVRHIAVLFGVVAAAGIFITLGASAALIGLVAIALAMAMIHFFQRNGFRIIFGALAAYVASAPLIMGQVARLFEAAGIALPGSFQSRAWCWEVVSNRIWERPFLGHGLEASSTWMETYATRPDWLSTLAARGADTDAWSRYPIVPGHPHNMALELWAETGMIGAALATLALALIGWRLPAPGDLSPRLRLGIAGIIGASLSMFSFAYSAWNEAFWASIILAIMALVIIDKAYAQSNEAP